MERTAFLGRFLSRYLIGEIPASKGQNFVEAELPVFRRAVLADLASQNCSELLAQYFAAHSDKGNDKTAAFVNIAWDLVAKPYVEKQEIPSLDPQIKSLYHDFEAGAFHVAWDFVLIDLARREGLEVAVTKALEFAQSFAARLARPYKASASVVRSYLEKLLAKNEGKIDTAIVESSVETLKNGSKGTFFDDLVLGDNYSQDRYEKVVVLGASLFSEVLQLLYKS